jgi:hypothetical protein
MQQLSADGPQSAWPAPPSAQLGGGPESAPRAIHPGATSGAVASLPGAPASCTAEPASSASSWEMLDSIATGAPRASGDGLLSLTAFASTKWLVVLASMADMESTRWGPLPPQPAVTKKADAISPLPVPVPTTPFIKRRIPSRGSSRTGTVGLGGGRQLQDEEERARRRRAQAARNVREQRGARVHRARAGWRRCRGGPP